MDGGKKTGLFSGDILRLFLFHLLCFLMLLPTSSLAGMVGGPCTYEIVYGIARISKQGSDETLARFFPQSRHIDGKTLPISRSLVHPIGLPISGGIGAIYPAELRVRTKGSCSPGKMRLLATEEFSSGTVIKLDRDGQIHPTAQQKLSQLAMTFKKLAPRWPQMQLEICGQTSSEGTEEYNLNLGSHHARQFAQKLEHLGVPHSQIKTFSSGERPCPRSIAFLEEPQNGACLSFILTDTRAEKRQEDSDYA